MVKISTNSKGMYNGKSHAEGGIPVVVDGNTNVEIEGNEYHICRDAMSSAKIYSFKNKSNKEILDSIYSSEGCKFVQGIANSGDFIVCKLVVLDDKKRTIIGTVKSIIDTMQSEKSCNVSEGGNKMEQGGGIENLNVKKFMQWYKGWHKGVADKMNIFITLPSIIAPFKEDNVVILDLFEKIDQNIDAKPYLKDIVDKADEYDVTIYLEPVPRYKFFLKNKEKRIKISKDYLISYYEKFDFKLTPNKMFMKRLPKHNMEKGGGIESEHKETYKKWKSLVNMSKSELKEFYDSQEGKDAGLSDKESNDLGISNGRESARWIMRMKDTPVSDWTPKMWEWANKQISFISRMSGNKGSLYDDKGNKTRKHTSLLIWGHNPKKMNIGGGIEFIPEKKGTLIKGNEIIKYAEKVNGNYRLVFYKIKESNGKVPIVCNAFDYCHKLDINDVSADELIDLIEKNNLMEKGGDIKELILSKKIELNFYRTFPDHALEYGIKAKNPLYIKNFYVTKSERLKGVGKKMLKYLDDYAIENGNDVIFGYINQKATFSKNKETHFNDKQLIKNWLHDNSYSVNDDDNNFHKVLGAKMKQGGNVITYRNKFNKKYGFELNESHSLEEIAKLTKLKLSALEDIYNKGIGAYKTNPESVRPNVKSKEQWAMARVYSAVMGGKASKIDANELERGKMQKGGELAKGIKTEMEHKSTIDKFKRKGISDKEVAKSIAQDHLKEDSSYYSKLAKMEGKMEDGGNLDDFDWDSIYFPSPEQEEKINQDIKKSKEKENEDWYQNSKFSKKWASTYQDAVNRTIKEYLDAKATYEDWASRQYKQNKGMVFIGGDDVFGEAKSIGSINENRRQRVLRGAKMVMDESIETLKELRLTNEEISNLLQDKMEDGGNLYHLGGDMSKHLAPNGNPSNLTHEQWHLVRTPEFKAWFGDWEKLEMAKIKDSAMDEVTLANISKNVSKVVDSNGEPLVVYHGGLSSINVFNTKNIYFSPYKNISGDFANYKYGDSGKVFEVFINIRNPKYFDAIYSDLLELESHKGFDGFIAKYVILDDGSNEGKQFVAFYPNQIKLADGTNTTFDGNNDDIRYKNGGEIKTALREVESARSVKYWMQPEFPAESYRYEQKGKPNSFVKIYDEKYNGDTILAYNKRGNLVGLFSISKGGDEQGAFKIVVREDSTNKGWGKKLLDEAEKQGIDIVGNIKRNSFSHSGRNLLRSWLGKKMESKMKDGGEIKKENKGGDCYMSAGNIVINNYNNIDFIGTPYLVHAEVTGQGAISGIKYGHAWIEDDVLVYDYSNGRSLKIPKDFYYAIGNIKTSKPKKYRKYTFLEAKRKMVKTGNYGCWDLDVQFEDGGQIINN